MLPKLGPQIACVEFKWFTAINPHAIILVGPPVLGLDLLHLDASME